MSAAILLWISTAIGCAYALKVLTVAIMVVLPLGIVLVSIWVVYEILQRRNWARVLLLVITMAGGAALASSLLMTPEFQAIPMGYAVRGMQSVLRFTAVLLLFTNPARSWFGRSVGSEALETQRFSAPDTESARPEAK